MSRIHLAALLVASSLAGCGGAAEAEEQSPATTRDEQFATSWSTCANPVHGFRVRYPTAWHTASLRPGDVCRRFHPDPFELVEGTDCCPHALEVHVVAQTVARTVEGYTDPVYYREVSADDVGAATRTAKVEVVTTGEGLHPAGTRIYAQVFEHGDGSLVVQTTAVAEESRYGEWKRVVDEAARTLSATTPAPGARESVQVFFANERLHGDPTLCTGVFARDRPLPKGLSAEDRLAVALSRLLEGPTREERESGYTSWFSAETAGMLRAVGLVDGEVARIDFDDFSALLNGANTSCGSAALLAALDATVRGASGGRSPVYSFGGSCAAFYEWLQSSAPPCAPVEGPAGG